MPLRAFDWAALPAEAVPAGWLVGIKMNYHQPIATGLIALSSPINIGRDFYNLDSSLGYPGVAAPGSRSLEQSCGTVTINLNSL